MKGKNNSNGGKNEHRIIFVYSRYSNYCCNNSYWVRNSSKYLKEINEIDIENNPKIKFITKGGIDELRKRVEREKQKITKGEVKNGEKILISTEQTVSQFLKGLKP